MTSSLVGSEMCIRDRYKHPGTPLQLDLLHPHPTDETALGMVHSIEMTPCLLYTSDAADDM
eukprot:2197998-Prorocentrum_lima.AAC.1